MKHQDRPQFCYMCGGKLAYNNELPSCSLHGVLWPLVRNAACAEAIVINNKKQLLLVKRAIEPMKGYWAFPGGFSDYGEQPEDAAAREVFEETGWRISIENLLGVYLDSFPGDKHSEHRWVTSYIASPIEHVEVVDPENERYEWFKLDELPARFIPTQLNRVKDLESMKQAGSANF